MKNTNKKYLLYLVIFILILILFFFLITNKTAIIQKLQRDFGPSNTEGLVNVGGLEWTVYKGYFYDQIPLPSSITNNKNFDNNTVGTYTKATNMTSLYNMTHSSLLDNGSLHEYTIELKGYFRPNKTGSWYMRTTSDDASYIWLGQNASQNRWTGANAFVNNGGLHGVQTIQSAVPALLSAGTYYPIYILMGEHTGGHTLIVEWLAPGSNQWSSDGVGFLFPTNIAEIEAQMSAKGVTWKLYNGYFADNVGFFSGNTPTLQGIAINMDSLNTITGGQVTENAAYTLDATGLPNPNWTWVGPNNTTQFSMEIFGYFKPSITGDWGFYTHSDDASYLWIGPVAENGGGYNTGNALVNNGGGHAPNLKQGSTKLDSYSPATGTINLQANQYYAFRVQFGESGGAYNLRIGWKPPGGTWTSNGDGYLFTSKTGAVSEKYNDHNYYMFIANPMQ